MAKTIAIYDKNGNAMQIQASVKSAYIGNGWFVKPPKKEMKES